MVRREVNGRWVTWCRLLDLDVGMAVRCITISQKFVVKGYDARERPGISIYGGDMCCVTLGGVMLIGGERAKILTKNMHLAWLDKIR